MLKSRTFVATPAYRGEVVMQYAHSLVRDSILALGNGHLVQPPYAVNDTLVHYARNRAVEAFLEGPCDNLVFIDADLGWEEGALLRLIETEGDVVCGLYRVKHDDESYPFSSLPGGFLGPVGPIMAGPSGFMKITRACAEAMAKAYPMPFEFDGPKGEDIAFCERAHGLGFSVVGIADIHFEHIGPKAWAGRASDALPRLAEAA
jgi:hypothetical protein